MQGGLRLLNDQHVEGLKRKVWWRGRLMIGLERGKLESGEEWCFLSVVVDIADLCHTTTATPLHKDNCLGGMD